MLGHARVAFRGVASRLHRATYIVRKPDYKDPDYNDLFKSASLLSIKALLVRHLSWSKMRNFMSEYKAPEAAGGLRESVCRSKEEQKASVRNTQCRTASLQRPSLH